MPKNSHSYKAIYGYSMNDPTIFFESESAVSASKELWGEWKDKYTKGIWYSLQSDRLNKYSYKGYIFFYKEDGKSILQPNEINLAIWNKQKYMNYNNRYPEKYKKARSMIERPIRSTHPITGEYCDFVSVTDAAENFYGNRSNIIRAIACDGTAYGWKFEYLEAKKLSEYRERPYKNKIR